MPNSWTDITAEIDNLAELKVVEYILRHTWGYQEYGIKKHITVDEFVRGRRRQDGTRLDKGTGLSERAVRYGLQKAVENRLIEEEIDDSDRGRIKKYYSLRMQDDLADVDPEHDLLPGVQTLHPSLQSLPPRGAAVAPRTEKETLERHNLSNFEKEHMGDFDEDDETESAAVPARRAERRSDAPKPSMRGKSRDVPRTPALIDPGAKSGHADGPVAEPPAGEGYASLRATALRLRVELEQERDAAQGGNGKAGRRRRPDPESTPAAAAPVPGPNGDPDPAFAPIGEVLPATRVKPVGSRDDRDRVAAYLADIAPQLGDQAPLPSSVTRALRLFRRAAVPPELWGDYLYRARSVTQEHSGSIKTKPPGNGFRPKPKMAYYFGVLEDLLGLKPEESPPSAPSVHTP
jgi:hypothetical protein